MRTEWARLVLVVIVLSACAGRNPPHPTAVDTAEPLNTPAVGESYTKIIGYKKSIIDEIIKKRRNLSRLQQCYERQLRKNPDLGGKVVVNFMFDVTGHVQSSAIKSSELDGFGKAAVEDCIVDVFLTLEFPKPKGGKVIVNYPLLFKSTRPQ